MLPQKTAKQRLNANLQEAADLRLGGQFEAAREILNAVALDPEVDALGPRTSLGLPRRLHAAMLKLAKAEGNLIERTGYQFHLVPPPALLAKYGRFTPAQRAAILQANKQPVPHVIHQIWIGDRAVPITTRAWADHAALRGFGYKLWREADLAEFGITDNPALRTMLDKGDYPGAVDVARYEILERLGGVYLDCDWYPARSDLGFDDLWPMTGLTVMAEDIPRNTSAGPVLLANSVIASPPNHPVFTRLNAILGEVVRDIPGAPAWWSTGPLIFTVVSRGGGSVSLAAAGLVAGALPQTATLQDAEALCAQADPSDNGLLIAWKPWA